MECRELREIEEEEKEKEEKETGRKEEMDTDKYHTKNIISEPEYTIIMISNSLSATGRSEVVVH